MPICLSRRSAVNAAATASLVSTFPITISLKRADCSFTWASDDMLRRELLDTSSIAWRVIDRPCKAYSISRSTASFDTDRSNVHTGRRGQVFATRSIAGMRGNN
jgi:hypothetical protein